MVIVEDKLLKQETDTRERAGGKSRREKHARRECKISRYKPFNDQQVRERDETKASEERVREASKRRSRKARVCRSVAMRRRASRSRKRQEEREVRRGRHGLVTNVAIAASGTKDR
eukprot:3087951-Pleurochrysis_carterae.AAC.3